jgi:hypothetical protein
MQSNSYASLREQYLTKKWKTSNVDDLCSLIEDIRMVTDKTQLADNNPTAMKLSMLEHEATRTYYELKQKKEKKMRTQVKIMIGIGLTALTLLQPYFVEEIEDIAVNTYNSAKNTIENIIR